MRVIKLHTLMGSSVAIGAIGGGAAGYVSGGDSQSVIVGMGVGGITGLLGNKVVPSVSNTVSLKWGGEAAAIARGGTEIGLGGTSGVVGTVINNGLNNEPLTNNIGKAGIVGALVPTIGGRAAASASGTSSKVANTIADVNSALIGVGAEKLQKVKPKGNKDAKKK